MDSQPRTPEAHVRLLTSLLQSSDVAELSHLRDLLGEHSVDPARAVLVDFFDDGGAYYGLLLLPNGQFVELDMYYIYEPERWRAGETVRWSGEFRWELLSTPPSTQPDEFISAARALLASNP